MKYKSQFKLIAILILFSLVGLELFQVYWMRSIYQTIRSQMESQISESLRMADYTEVFTRMDEIKEKDKSAKLANGEVENNDYYFKFDLEESSSDSIRRTVKPLESPSSLQIHFYEDDEEEEDENGILNSLPQYLEIMESLEMKVLFALHNTIDSIQPINYTRFSNSLEMELREREINVPFTLEVYEPENDSYQFLYMGTPDGKPVKPSNSNIEVEYKQFSHEEAFYRLTLQKPGRIILWRMMGILLSSFLLTLLVAIAFFYMLRTILKQKTEEELKTDFTNNVTHELKTPIAVAVAANDALLNYDDTVTDKQRKYLSIVNEQLSRLTGMVEQILSLSVENRSTFKLNIQPVKVAELIPPIIEQQKLKTQKQVTITSEIEDDLIIRADRTHLHNMLNNLVENAIKYSDSEPVIILLSSQQKEKEIIVSVTDNGMGISPENQKRIFDKFFRVPHGNIHNVKGYGLGLFYIKDMMARHRGNISVQSQPGKGSTFSLIFRNK